MRTLYRQRPEIVLQAEAHNSEILIRKVADGVLDVAFFVRGRPAGSAGGQRSGVDPLIMVASRPDLNPQFALKEGHVMSEWGASFAAAFARHFPEASLPAIRMNFGCPALACLLECGGSAYLPEQVVTEHYQRGATAQGERCAGHRPVRLCRLSWSRGTSGGCGGIPW
ncbi:MAG: hypothetical protein P8079_01715 [Gammaproteobacteria bacterium]